MKTMKLKPLIMALFAAGNIAAQPQAVDPDTMTLDYYSQANYTPKETYFSFLGFPQKGKRAILRIYSEPLGGRPLKTVKMKQEERGGWLATVKGDCKGKYYTFDISGDKKNPRETPGVFATAVGVNGQRGAIIDIRQTDPDGWAQDRRPALKSPADLVIYEMHFRDFSVSPTSGLQHKGKFLCLRSIMLRWTRRVSTNRNTTGATTRSTTMCRREAIAPILTTLQAASANSNRWCKHCTKPASE